MPGPAESGSHGRGHAGACRVEHAGAQGPANVPSLGEVYARVQEEGPAVVAALRVCIENAGKRQTEVDESALGAHRTLRSNSQVTTRIGAKYDVRRAVDRSY